MLNGTIGFGSALSIFAGENDALTKRSVHGLGAATKTTFVAVASTLENRTYTYDVKASAAPETDHDSCDIVAINELEANGDYVYYYNYYYFFLLLYFFNFFP